MSYQEEDDNRLHITTISTTGVNPEQIEAEAKRFAMRTGGILLMAMAEKRLTEDQLASQLQCPKRQVRSMVLGENWKAYLPLAALCLALEIKMDLKISREL